MDRLLDPALPDPEFVALLEQPLQFLYTSPSTQERNMAQQVLTTLQDQPNAWLRVDKVIDNSSSSPQAKFFALQILDKLIRYRWKSLPRDTCKSVRNYVVNKVVELTRTDATLAREKVFVSKLNLVLVQIVKQEWPAHWRKFMEEITTASTSSASLCENNMQILALLSEEVFDFSTGQMTQARIVALKNQFTQEFASVFHLCQYVLDQTAELQTSRPSLVLATLHTLRRFLSWIPLGYIFEMKLIECLVGLMKAPALRHAALGCLVEIGGLAISGNTYDAHFKALFLSLMEELVVVLPPSADIAAAYDTADDEAQAFTMDLALFFTGFLRLRLRLLDLDSSPEDTRALKLALELLVRISMVSDVEVFKTCLEWWHRLASALYAVDCSVPRADDFLFSSFGGEVSQANGSGSRGEQHSRAVGEGVALLGTSNPAVRKAFYTPVLAAVRRVLISRMAKPEEVLIVEDDNGEIVRETTRDTDAITLYKAMRETLVFLTHLDTVDTEEVMLGKLARQIDGSEWSWRNINTLCWAVGSISGAMSEEEEKRFLVTVIKELLHLVEQKRGKDNKAVVASNIMYVVGQYPRFLRAHWKFLRTVVHKLFEFMHEPHPGVQDMACDTFLKIAHTCRRKFVVLQSGEPAAFIVQMLDGLPDIVNELEPHQIHAFYDAAGCIIAAAPEGPGRGALVLKLFDLPNRTWANLVVAATNDASTLRLRDTAKAFVNLLKTNARVAASLGPPFVIQLAWLQENGLLLIYRSYAQLLTAAISTGLPQATKTSEARNMRAVKKEMLRVVEAFVSSADPTTDRAVVLNQVVNPMSETVLQDYASSPPEARDSEVLSLFATIIEFTGGLPLPAVRLLFRSLFACTLDMIKNNFEDFPDARLHFFKLLRVIAQHNFSYLFNLDEEPAAAENDFRAVMNAIAWAFKHTERNVAETGLVILQQVLRSVDASPHASYFYRHYFQSTLNDILSVLTDTLHRPGFKLHAAILRHLLATVTSGVIQESVWDVNAPDQVARSTANGTVPASNAVFVRAHLLHILAAAFPNMGEAAVADVVRGLLDLRDDKAFKGHLRDFLVRTREFSVGDNADLYDDEKQALLVEQQRLEAERLARTPGLAPAQPGVIDDGMAS